MANPTPPRVALGVLSFVALLASIYVIWTARLLRPANDDYGIAGSVDKGLVLGTWGWWTSWSGDLTSTFTNQLFVGLPALHLPWSFASAITFLAAAASVVGVMWWVTFLGSNSRVNASQVVRLTTYMTPISLIAWWGYWWVTASFGTDGDNSALLAVGITMWQNLNASAVIVPSFLILGWLVLETRKRTSQLSTRVLYFILGLLAGFSGPVFAASTVMMIGTLAVASWLRTQASLANRGALWLMAAIGTTMAALASHFSPGSQARKLRLPDPELNLDLVFRLTSQGIPGGLGDWWSALAAPGAASLVIVFIGLSLLMVFLDWRPRVGYLVDLGLGLLMFSLIMSFVNRISEFFAYEAYWHLVAPRTLTWMALATLALAIGAWLAQLDRNAVTTPLAVFAAAVGTLVIVASLANLGSNVEGRYAQWETGPAPWAGAISDIEVPWIRSGWERLMLLRDGPLRRAE